MSGAQPVAEPVPQRSRRVGDVTDPAMLDPSWTPERGRTHIRALLQAEHDDLARQTHAAKTRATELADEAARIRSLVRMLRVARRGETIICQCAWCKRFQIGDEWLHPEAIGHGGQRIAGSLQRHATGGICDDCWRSLQDRR